MICGRLRIGADRRHPRPDPGGGIIASRPDGPAWILFHVVRQQRVDPQHRRCTVIGDRCRWRVGGGSTTDHTGFDIPLHIGTTIKCGEEGEVLDTARGYLIHQARHPAAATVEPQRRALGIDHEARSRDDLNSQTVAKGIELVRQPCGVGEGQRSRPHRPDEQTSLQVTTDDGAAGEVGINAPQTVEVTVVIGGVGVEVGDLGHVERVRSVEDTKSTAIIGLVDQIIDGVDVVADGTVTVGVFIHQDRIGQIGNIDHEGLGRNPWPLVQFISEVEVLLIGGQPALVAVGPTRIDQLSQQYDVGLVGDIEDIETHRAIAGTEERHLAAGEGTRLHLDDLSIMHISIGPTALEHRSAWIVEVVKAQSIAATTTSVQVTRVSIDGDIVRGESSPGGDGVGQGDITVIHIGKVDDLDPTAPFGNRIGEVLISLHISPETVGTGDGSEDVGVSWIGDFDHGSTTGMSHQRILTPTGRSVAPTIVAVGDARLHLGQGDPRLQVDSIRWEPPDRTERL